VKLAVVVQRYGTQINGGAELHAHYIVELLAKQHQVDVLTTCARDYVTWKGEYPEGTETVRGIDVRRFAVSRERDPDDFGRRSAHVFEHTHSLADELAWLDSEGPTSPALIDYVRAHAGDYDYIFFFSYRYYHAYQGVRAVASKAILVPTAERDATIGLSMFGPIFRGVRAIMYNSHEERAMIQAATGNTQVPGVVVGIGSDVPRHPVAARFRRKYDISDPFIVYVGRIDENKGCRELFSFFTSYRPRLGQRLKLVLIGHSILPIPDHPNVHHLGFVSDQDKFDAMAAADALIMPSYYESLSMVALEAWALGRPVLANGRCDVLRGQCIRSRAGLYYETFEEFAETLFTLTTNRTLAEALGENGRHYFEQHYAWPVIERKYSDILHRLAQEDAAGRPATPIEALPGWLTRRRKVLRPGIDVLKGLPEGPAIRGDGREDASEAPPPASSSWTSLASGERGRRDPPGASLSASASGARSGSASAVFGGSGAAASAPGSASPASGSGKSMAGRPAGQRLRKGDRRERSGTRGSSSGQQGSRSGGGRPDRGRERRDGGQGGQPRESSRPSGPSSQSGQGGAGTPGGSDRRDRDRPGRDRADRGGVDRDRADRDRDRADRDRPDRDQSDRDRPDRDRDRGTADRDRSDHDRAGRGGAERAGTDRAGADRIPGGDRSSGDRAPGTDRQDGGDRASGPRPPRRDGSGPRGRRSGDRRSGPRGGR